MAERSTLRNRAYYDQFSKSYENKRHAGYHALIDDLEADIVRPHARDSDVLEVGVGTGLVLSRLRPDARHAVGMDLSGGMLESARARRLDVTQADACHLPFDDARFDVAYSFKVLAHVPDLEGAIAEMARVTKPGGRVFVELYNRWSIRWLARRVMGGRAIGTAGIKDDQVYVRYHTPEEMRRALPPDLELVRWHGIRIVTTLPQLISIPIVGGLFARVERRAASGPLARLGGFLIMECEKR